MAVYVDTMKAPYRGMIMCHMDADTQEELLEMARNIGVDARHIQHRGTYKEHFDISISKKVIALRYGAVQVGRKALMRRMILKRRRREWLDIENAPLW